MNFQTITDTLAALVVLYAVGKAAYTQKLADWRTALAVFGLFILEAIWNAVQPVWNGVPSVGHNGLYMLALGIQMGQRFWRDPNNGTLLSSTLSMFMGSFMLGQYIPISDFSKLVLFVANIILCWAYYQLLYFQAARRLETGV